MARIVNYYPFHLGDYAAHTGHLEPMEDLAYRRLLDVYYMREGALPADIQVTAKLVRLRSCAADVESVLSEFFVLTEDGWRHARCDDEIAKMQDKQAKARDAAEQSVKSRKATAERRLAEEQAAAERALGSVATGVELPTPTPTPTPIKEAKASRVAFAPPEWVPAEQWQDFVQNRKAMKGVPFTDAAAKGVVAELEKLARAGHDPEALLQLAVTNGWRTVYAPKIDHATRSTATGETAYQRSMRERVEAFAPGVAARAPGQQRPLTIIEEVHVPAIASR